VLCGVVGSVGDDGVIGRGFCVNGVFQVCGGSVGFMSR
jgi:hypothetical protein